MLPDPLLPEPDVREPEEPGPEAPLSAGLGPFEPPGSTAEPDVPSAAALAEREDDWPFADVVLLPPPADPLPEAPVDMPEPEPLGDEALVELDVDPLPELWASDQVAVVEMTAAKPIWITVRARMNAPQLWVSER